MPTGAKHDNVPVVHKHKSAKVNGMLVAPAALFKPVQLASRHATQTVLACLLSLIH